jgi:hypothetical protein
LEELKSFVWYLELKDVGKKYDPQLNGCREMLLTLDKNSLGKEERIEISKLVGLLGGGARFGREEKAAVEVG